LKKILNLFDVPQNRSDYTSINYKTEILSGFTVALALVPEAVAFSLIAGLSPLTGLYAAVVVACSGVA
jgi:SulP family sulfate permease